jgi:hypothetical protein
MKKLCALLGLIVLGCGSLTAQLKQGQISYDIHFSSDDPQTSAYIGQMEGSTLEIYFGNNSIRTEMYMGEFMTTINIMHKEVDTSLTLLDGMMGKIAMKTTLDDLDDEQRLALSEREVELVNETKEIMGYNCKKAIITTTDGQESIVWYTDEIVPDYRSGQYLYEEIPGVPLQMEATWGKMKMVMIAFEYKKKLKKPENLFSMEVPNGFTVRTAEEMKAMRQGRG